MLHSSVVVLTSSAHTWCCSSAATPTQLPSCSCQRVAVAVRTDLPQSLLWCTVYCSDAAGAAGRQQAAAHLAAFLQGQLDTPLLEQPQQVHAQGSRAGKHPSSSGSASSSGSESADEDDEADSVDEELELDEYLQPPAMRRHWQPLLTFVTVPELPRG